MKIAIIGGSGLYDIDNPSEAEEQNIVTPWGETSSSILKTKSGENEIFFLSLDNNIKDINNIFGAIKFGFLSTNLVAKLNESFLKNM